MLISDNNLFPLMLVSLFVRGDLSPRWLALQLRDKEGSKALATLDFATRRSPSRKPLPGLPLPHLGSQDGEKQASI